LKKLLTVTLAGLCAAAAAYGALGDIVGSFQVSNNNAGLGISSRYLYCNDYSPGVIYMVNSTNGSIYGSFNSVHSTNSRGLAFDGTYLWQNKAYSAPYETYRTNAANGSIYASFALPTSTTHGVAPRATGDYGAGTDALFQSYYSGDIIYVMNLSGSITSSFSIPSECMMYEIAYDWRSGLVWGAMNAVSGQVPIWGVDTSGSLVASFNVSISNSYGLTYAGEYLWAGTTAGWIYRIHCPKINVGVKPASMGKIKAVFR
jgi:hypothetical protein